MRALDARALDLVARVAESPLEATQVDPELADELVEMHVLAREGDLLRLDTAVFLEEGIRALELLVAVPEAVLITVFYANYAEAITRLLD